MAIELSCLNEYAHLDNKQDEPQAINNNNNYKDPQTINNNNNYKDPIAKWLNEASNTNL